MKIEREMNRTNMLPPVSPVDELLQPRRQSGIVGIRSGG